MSTVERPTNQRIPEMERLRESREMGREPVREVEKTAELVTGGSVAEAIGGVGAIVLAIIGLGGIYPTILLPVGVLALAAGFVFEGAAIVRRYHELLQEIEGGYGAGVEHGVGVTSELIAGFAGIALGILALLGIVSTTLTAVAVLIFGAGLVFSSGMVWRMNELSFSRRWTKEASRALAREAVVAGAGLQVLVGCSSIVLGIIALVNPAYSLTLLLVAVLALGTSQLFSGGALAGRMMTILKW